MPTTHKQEVGLKIGLSRVHDVPAQIFRPAGCAHTHNQRTNENK